MKEAAGTATTDFGHGALYRLGGLAAYLVALLTLAEVLLFAFFPQPGTVGGWFALLQSNRILGLLDFWALELLMYAMFPLVFLALYFGLRCMSDGLAAIALAFALLGTAIFFATNSPFAMASLSDQYAAATTDAEQSILLAAGYAVLANTGQRAVGGFNTGLFLVSIAGLIVSWLMLRSDSFGRSAAYLGLAAYALSLLDYVREALTKSPAVALLVILPSAALLVIWFVVIGRKLARLGRRASSLE